MKARLGTEGTTAVAHKLARLIYVLIQTKKPFDEKIVFQTNDKTKARRIQSFRKTEEKLGFSNICKLACYEYVIQGVDV